MKLTRYFAFAAAMALFTASAVAQAPAAPGNAAAPLSAEELDKLVGRIALYPDDLVAVILPASTNPLQLVQADRFLEKRKSDKNLKLDDNWDDPVKTLLNYPEVVKMMSADLDWTSDLGEAVVADLGAVMEAVQVFRRKTQSAGNLKSDGKQNVVVEKEVIKIVSADPQVIYVPQYNPSTVVVAGAPIYPYYPPYPSYYYPYPPGAALATGIIWGAAIGAIWNGGHYGAHYGGGGNNINIDNSTNINRGGNTVNQRPSGSGSGSSQWKSNKQPGQVSSSTGRSQQANRVGDTGGRGSAGAGGGGARPSTQPAGGGRSDFGGSGGGGARPSTQPSGGAFGGSSSSGRQTQMDSSRGASSRGTTGQGARQVPPSGGAGRASMGGGRAGGGGGGGGRAGGGGGRRR